MSSQSYFQKAILSELGISSWQLQEPSLLAEEFQNTALQAKTSQSNLAQPKIAPVKSSQAEHSDIKSLKGALHKLLEEPSKKQEKEPVQLQVKQKPLTAEPVKLEVDVTDKVVLVGESVSQRLPAWWWRDVLLTLNIDKSRVIKLKENETPKNADKALLALVEEGTAATLFATNNKFTVSSDMSLGPIKKQLWAVLRSRIQTQSK